MLWQFLLYLTLSGQLSLAAPRSRPVRPRHPATIPMHEVQLEPDHPLSRRDNYPLRGGLNPHYYVDISFAGGTTSVLFDTGSADLVLDSRAVPSSGVGDTSSTCSENYGGRGAISGKIQSTTYGFGGYSASGFFCNIQNFIVNGILGFRYPATSGGGVSVGQGQNPLTLFNQQGLSGFGLYIANYQGGGGAYTPNDYDSSYIADGASFMTESNNRLGGGAWAVDITGNFEYEGTSYPIGRTAAIVDSGTTGITVPQAVAQQIWTLVGADPNTGSYGSNCDPGGDPITFITASGNRLDIPAVVYVVDNGDGTCSNAFRIRPANLPNIIFGTGFMRAYYTYFDINLGQISFAESGG